VFARRIQALRESYFSVQGERAIHQSKKQVAIAVSVMSGISMNLLIFTIALKEQQRKKNYRRCKMMSQIPIRLEGMKKEDIDREILRAGIIAELDAVNLYEQMAAMTQRKDIKAILMDIAKEEKTHVGEFQTLLLRLDKEQERELEEGRKEVEEITKTKSK